MQIRGFFDFAGHVDDGKGTTPRSRASLRPSRVVSAIEKQYYNQPLEMQAEYT
jgi:hypothetical protein